MDAFLTLDYRQFFGEVGVAQADANQEAVELRFRQGEGAFVLDGVLSGQNDEGVAQVMGCAVHRNLPLFHSFQQGRLRLGGGAVDLVGQDYLGHHRAGAELKLPVALVVDGDAGDVAGQQVGGELDALELASQRGGQALGQHGLADAGNVLDQDVALGR